MDAGSLKVVEMLAKVLRTTVEALPDGAAMGEVENWDSLAQLMILSALEQEYGLSIEPDVAVDLNTVAKICAYVKTHEGR